MLFCQSIVSFQRFEEYLYRCNCSDDSINNPNNVFASLLQSIGYKRKKLNEQNRFKLFSLFSARFSQCLFI